MSPPIRPEFAPSDALSRIRSAAAPPKPKRDIAAEAREAIRIGHERVRNGVASREDLDRLIADWDDEIKRVNTEEAGALPANPAIKAGLEALETPLAGVPGGKLAMSGARKLVDPETPFRQHQADVNRETSDVPFASFAGRLAGGGISGAPLAKMSGITAGATFGAADQFLHNDPDLGTSLAGRTGRAVVGAGLGAVAGAIGQSGVNYARAKEVGPLEPMQVQLKAERSALDEATYGIAGDEARQYQINLANAQAAARGQNAQNEALLKRERLAAVLENSERKAAADWNKTLETAPQPKPTLREALEGYRERSAEVARRATPKSGSAWSEPNPRPTGWVEQQRFDTMFEGMPPNAGPAASRQGVPPKTAEPLREHGQALRAREALDRRIAEGELPPEPLPGPGLGAKGVEPIPVPKTVQDIGRTPVVIPQHPAEVQRNLANPFLKPFIDDVKASAEWQHSPQDEGTLIRMAYKLASEVEGNLGRFIENSPNHLANKNLMSGNVKEAKAALMEAAKYVSPSFPDAVRLHAVTSSEIGALNAGYDATKRLLGNANPASNKTEMNSPEAFIRSIDDMTPEQAAQAARGTASQIPQQMGFRANQTSGLGFIPSLAHAYRASRFLRPLDEAALGVRPEGTTAAAKAAARKWDVANMTRPKTLQDVMLAMGGSATPKTVEDVERPIKTLSGALRKKKGEK